MKASEFDDKFDRGEDVADDVDWSSATRLSTGEALLTLEVPGWMLNLIDREADRLGENRQAVVRRWLAERLKSS